MRIEEIKALDEANLINMARNQVVSEAIRLEAAVLLYQRGSKFCATEEFAAIFKAKVLDRLLVTFKNAPAFQPANVPLESLARLYEHVGVLTTALGESDRVHAGNIDAQGQLHQEALTIHRAELDASDSDLHDRINHLARMTAEANLDLAIVAAKHRGAIEKQIDARVQEFEARASDLQSAIDAQGVGLKADIEEVRKTVRRVVYAFGIAIPTAAAVGMYLTKFLK
jgi:hypothetical protein